MSFHIRVALCALAALAATSAQAEKPMPQGEFVGKGVYCNFGLRYVVPRGYDAIALGQGVVFRLQPPGQVLKAEVDYYPARDDLPGFSIFRDFATLSCKDGFRSERSQYESSAARLDSLWVLDQRCVSAEASYGILLARGDLVFNEKAFVAHVQVLFGDEEFSIGAETVSSEYFFDEIAARRLANELIAGLGVCSGESGPTALQAATGRG